MCDNCIIVVRFIIDFYLIESDVELEVRSIFLYLPITDVGFID